MFWKTGCNCLPGCMEKAARKHREGFELRQPQNYIEAVDSDGIEMKTAELLSGIDGTMMFRYNSRDTFKTLSIYLSEYQLGQRVSHKKVLELSYEDVKSSTNGLIVITPDFDNFTAKLIAADKYSKYMTEIPILEGVTNREYYGRSATSIEIRLPQSHWL